MIIRPVRSSLVLVCGMAGALLSSVGQADIFQTLAKDAVVCYGEKAPKAEQDAATMLAEKFRAAGGPAENLVTAEALKKDAARAALAHIIAVGTWSSNVICRDCWGKIAVDPLQKAKVEHLEKPPEYFSVAGAGHFTGTDVGYIEANSNRYTIFLRASGALPKRRSEDKQHPEEFFVIKITGSGSAGVVRAAKALADQSLLLGVLPSSSQKLDPDWDAMPKEKDTVSHLGEPQLLAPPPPFVPSEPISANNKSVSYLGWYQAVTPIYYAFSQVIGARPHHIWRIKYRTEEGFRRPASFLDADPHGNRGNELILMEMTTDADALKAIQGFRASAEKQHPDQAKFTDIEIAGWKGIKASVGDTFLARGKYFVMCSLQSTHSPLLLEKLGAP